MPRVLSIWQYCEPFFFWNPTPISTVIWVHSFDSSITHSLTHPSRLLLVLLQHFSVGKRFLVCLPLLTFVGKLYLPLHHPWPPSRCQFDMPHCNLRKLRVNRFKFSLVYV